MTFQQKFLIIVLLSALTALLVAVTMRSEGGRRPSGPGVSVWLVGVSVALLSVGVVSNTLLRHLIQIAPVALALAVGARRARFKMAAALPVFTFWFFAMGGIWVTLLGIAPIFTGSYGPTEVVLTVIIGLASVCGLVAIRRQGNALSLGPRLGTVLTFAILQPLALLLSF
jgi:hypothetical protein